MAVNIIDYEKKDVSGIYVVETHVTHHRNPSGLNNKVKFLLSESERDKKKLMDVYNSIIKTQTAFKLNEIDIPKEHMIATRNSWRKALDIASSAIYTGVSDARFLRWEN